MRRSTVLSLPLQCVFPGLALPLTLQVTLLRVAKKLAYKHEHRVDMPDRDEYTSLLHHFILHIPRDFW